MFFPTFEIQHPFTAEQSHQKQDSTEATDKSTKQQRALRACILTKKDIITEEEYEKRIKQRVKVK